MVDVVDVEDVIHAEDVVDAKKQIKNLFLGRSGVILAPYICSDNSLDTS